MINDYDDDKKYFEIKSSQCKSYFRINKLFANRKTQEMATMAPIGHRNKNSTVSS